MNLYQILGRVDNISDFVTIDDFSEFAKNFLEFIYNSGMQADIVSRNESNYHFYQYKEEGHYCITRPINSDLFIDFSEFDKKEKDFKYALKHIKEIKEEDTLRENINHYIYTCQQCIGAALDAFNNPNKARKRNGLYFEILIRAVIDEVGVIVGSGDEKIPVGENEPSMKFQHDVIIKDAEENIKAIGQLKTSSKDRLDKIFLDKYMYSKLTDLDIPHFAIFLNDVQRKEIKSRNQAMQYGINSTFLPGHFNAYRVALNPLDGVYYFDMRPLMKTSEKLSSYIKSFDYFLVEDLWNFLK